MVGTLRKDQRTFFISRTFLLGMRNISVRNCRQNQTTR